MGNIAEEEVTCWTVQDHDSHLCLLIWDAVKGKLAKATFTVSLKLFPLLLLSSFCAMLNPT